MNVLSVFALNHIKKYHNDPLQNVLIEINSRHK